MSRYRYRACDTRGNIVQGQLEAANSGELDARLRARGLELLSGKPAPAWAGRFRRRIPRRELIHFCFQLEQLLDAGVPMLDALADLADPGEGDSHAAMQALATDLRAEVERGQPLSAAMARHPQAFDDVFRGMLRAGETTGDPASVLRQIAADLARADEIAAQARKAAIYPTVVIALLGGAVVVSLTQVVPQVATLFHASGETLPLPTRMLIGFSAWFGQYGWLPPLAFLILAAGSSAIASRHAGFRLWLHALALRLPLVGPIRQRLALARIASVLAMLYASGVTVIDALTSAARATPNLAIRAGIETAGAHIATGQGIASAFASTGLFPRLVTRMLHLGEQTGRLDNALGQLVYFYERDAREAIERLQAAIEPALTVAMGLLMMWIALAVLGPVYDIITRLPV
ncbi:MAG: type II secretion system F family protein [Azoarcus sp.]|jgi:type IV pilus assembly protein PilC|nr:type II secretion system F family protein [Azoarcus sp.]